MISLFKKRNYNWCKKNLFLFHNMCIKTKKTNYFSYPGKHFKRYTCTWWLQRLYLRNYIHVAICKLWNITQHKLSKTIRYMYGYIDITRDSCLNSLGWTDGDGDRRGRLTSFSERARRSRPWNIHWKMPICLNLMITLDANLPSWEKSFHNITILWRVKEFLKLE